MFQPAGDFGFAQESLPTHWIIGMRIQNLLERDFAVQFFVECHEYRAQSAARMRAQHAESLTIGSSFADCVGDRAIGFGRSGADVLKCRLDLGIAERGKFLTRRPTRWNGRQAPLGITAVALQVPRDEGVDGTAIIRIEIAPRNQVLGDRPRLVARPGLKRRDEFNLVDQAILKREQPKEQIPIGGGGRHGDGSGEGERIDTDTMIIAQKGES
jgi:hypothetical protein